MLFSGYSNFTGVLVPNYNIIETTFKLSGNIVLTLTSMAIARLIFLLKKFLNY